VIRPTSETIIGHFFAKWIQSYRDLPLLINQWANVIRWEMRTRMFLRTTEFLWQEGHTAHSSHEEAHEEVLRMLDVYADVAENVMAVPVVRGLKTHAERFAGAVSTYAIEAMMQNGMALQMGTSHDLGQNFGKAFDVTFQSKEGKLDHVWQTSWGVSTRLVGGLIMSHSDDKGLVLPPKVAPRKAVLVPIFRKDEERTQVMEVAQKLGRELGAHLDTREGQSPGAKFFHWERRGVPVVFELGPRDVAAGKIVLKRRDTGAKEVIAQEEAAGKLAATLESMQTDLLARARARLKENTVLANSIEEVEEILRDATAEKGGGKFVMAHLKDDPKNDERVKQFKASIRNIPLVDEFDGPGKCILTGETVDRRAVIAKAY
jgi:prolyl-tRNA synthetase